MRHFTKFVSPLTQYYLRCYIVQHNRLFSTGCKLDDEELKHFRKLADKWWHYSGAFQPLHAMNVLRVPFIRDALTSNRDYKVNSRPLQGLHILDVGCGGGLLTEPLARLGANVTGIDLVYENLLTARAHASRDPSLCGRVQYHHCSVNDLLQEKTAYYNAVVMSEVIEHVSKKENIIQDCCALLKDAGAMFITTISKTLLAQLLAVFAVENVLNIVPKGTHDWNKFIEPDQMSNILTLYDCHTQIVQGMQYNPITKQWNWSSDTNINYALHAVKGSS